ncbi:MAG: entericidin A/B family lipoprotein [Pseudobdellovibrionaceae bacterium]|jgi:predicted small secreted protein|nr:entericidin A/B family lipoprotein [Pseudobdellovibrionaceae bacterium]
MSVLRILTLSTLLVSALSLAACNNTIRGAGEDIERAGAAIQKSAN